MIFLMNTPYEASPLKRAIQVYGARVWGRERLEQQIDESGYSIESAAELVSQQHDPAMLAHVLRIAQERGFDFAQPAQYQRFGQLMLGAMRASTAHIEEFATSPNTSALVRDILLSATPQEHALADDLEASLTQN